jgi:dihydroneopterin aldolase
MTDAVFVTGLSLHAYHGVMHHEARVGQTFGLDLVLDTDLTDASRSDKLADTVGYDQVVEIASKAFNARRYRLVEAAAGAVAAAVLDRFPRVARVRVTVHKPHAPIAATFCRCRGQPSCALASVADLTFLPAALPRVVARNAHVRASACCKGIRTPEPGHRNHG